MLNIIKNAKYNIFLGASAVLTIIYLSGNLGAGEFLNNHVAFGYGGGLGYLIQPVVASNQPLYLPAQREGRLFDKTDNNMLLELEIPPATATGPWVFESEDLVVNPGLAPTCYNPDAFVAGGRIFNLTSKNENNQPVATFNRNLTISITIPELPEDLSGMGVYYLDSNNRWRLIQKAYFTPQNKTAFQVNNLAVFAVINAPGLPKMIQTAGNCFEAPAPVSGQVLGIKKYAEGTLLRTPDHKVYIVEKESIRYISSPSELNQYTGKKIFNISFDELNRTKEEATLPEDIVLQGKVIEGGGDPIVRDEEQSVLGVKIKNIFGTRIYADGALLRTPDDKVYLVVNPTIVYIANLPQSIYQWAGNRIYDVGYDDIAEYRDQRIIPEIQEITNVKRFGEGELLRTRDWKVYIIENGTAKHIATLAGTADRYYQGKPINDVDYGILAQYKGSRIPAAPQQVLGIKQYADGTLLRTPDYKVYLVKDEKLKLIATLKELENYAGKKIFNINFEELASLKEQENIAASGVIGGGQKVLGIKQYADGTLLRTPDYKLYQIVDQKIKHIGNVPGPQDSYDGKKVLDVDYAVIAEYERLK